MIHSFYDRLMQSDEMTLRLLSAYDPIANKDIGKYTEILRVPFTESLNISVSHGYQGFNHSTASILNRLSTAWNELKLKYSNTSKEQIQPLINLVAQFTDKVQQVESQGTLEQSTSFSDFYKSWVGTDVNIPLTFSTRVYTYIDRFGVIKTPDEQVKNLMKYFLGRQTGTIQTGGGFIKQISSGAGFNYSAPNGFIESDSYTGAIKQNGFAVCFGNRFTITRLLLTNFSLTPSKERVEISNGFSTMFYNLSFMLMPIYLFTLLDVLNLLGSDILPTHMVSSIRGNEKGFVGTSALEDKKLSEH